MNDKEYLLYEIAQAEKDHDNTYFIDVQFKGTTNKSKNLSLKWKYLEAIKKAIQEVEE